MRVRVPLGGVAWLLGPAVAFLLVHGVGDGSPAALFRAALAALIALTVVGAFGANVGWRSLTRLVGAAAAVGACLVVAAGSGAAGLAGAFLALAVGAAAAGLAALGRRLGIPSVAGGAIAVLVLWTAMAGLFWADPIADGLPSSRRRAFRQAVLHVDPALALAYDATGYDRLRAPDVYFDVPLASSLYDRPAASTTGATWLAVGLLAGGVAALRRRRGTAGRVGPR